MDGFHIRTEKVDSTGISILCPACGIEQREVRVWDLKQVLYVFYVVPVFKYVTTIVDCPCGKKIYSQVRAKDLLRIDASFRSRYLYIGIPPILVVLVFGGLIIWPMPLLSFIWIGLTHLWARKFPGWIRNLSTVILVLSLIYNAVFLIALMHER